MDDSHNKSSKPESRRGHWGRPPLFPCMTMSTGLPVRNGGVGCGWDKIRQSVGGKRLPSAVQGCDYYEDVNPITWRSGKTRRNAMVGSGFREYDYATLDGVREAMGWWRGLGGKT